MKSWNFLIQQEGDNTWLPLESPGSEVLEGRYRIMARTDHPNCTLDLQISHLDLETLPPKHRVHRRQARTTAKGLVALLPFTLLKSGVWEIRCQSAPMPSPATGDLSSPSPPLRAQKLQIQVLPQEAESELDLADLYEASTEESAPTPETPPDFELSLENESFPSLDNGFSLTEMLSSPGDSKSASVTSLDGRSEERPIEDLEDYLAAEDLIVDASSPIQDANHRPTPVPGNQPLTSSLPPSPDQATAGADDIEEGLMQTADEMAAHIIEAMNAEFDRLQSGGAKLSEDCDAADAREDRDAAADAGVEDRDAADVSGDSDEPQYENPETAGQFSTSNALEYGAPQPQEVPQNPPILSSTLEKEGSEHQPNPAKAPESDSAPEDSPSSNSAESSHASPNSAPSPSPQWTHEQLNALGCQIILARECYTVINDQLILTGMIEGSVSAAEINAANPESDIDQEPGQTSEMAGGLATVPLAVRVQLIQPQTGDRILEHDASLVLPSLPSPFSVLMTIPKNIPTHILVGEISLCVAGPAQSLESDTTQVLAQQSFTVTVDLNTLLDTVTLTPPPPAHSSTGNSTSANRMEENPLAEPCLPASQANMVKATQREFQTVGHNPIPPKLTSPVSSASNGTASPVTQKLNSEATGEAPPSSRKPSLELPPFLQADEDSGPSPMAIAIAKAMQASMQSLDSKPPSPEDSDSSKDDVGGMEDQVNAENDAASPPTADVTESLAASLDARSPVDAPEFELLDPRFADPNAVGDRPNFSLDSPPSDDNSEPLTRSAHTSDGSVVTDMPSFESERLDNPFGMFIEDEDLGTNPVSVAPNALPPEDQEEVSFDVPKSHPAAAPPQSSCSDDSAPTIPNTPANLASRSAASEYVVEDPSISVMAGEAALRDPRVTPESQSMMPAHDTNLTASPTLPEHMAIPTPTLHVPEDELVAGFPIRIAITLPQSSVASLDARGATTAPVPIASESVRSLIFVKLWVQDRQTRSILDGPRWLVDFIANGDGELEAMTQLVLPIGCLEVSVEAIAVEMATQRESHKVTIHRTIMPTSTPAALTTFTFDELN